MLVTKLLYELHAPCPILYHCTTVQKRTVYSTILLCTTECCYTNYMYLVPSYNTVPQYNKGQYSTILLCTTLTECCYTNYMYLVPSYTTVPQYNKGQYSTILLCTTECWYTNYLVPSCTTVPQYNKGQ